MRPVQFVLAQRGEGSGESEVAALHDPETCCNSLHGTHHFCEACTDVSLFFSPTHRVRLKSSTGGVYILYRKRAT